MKKLLTITAIGLIAAQASAVSIAWNATGVAFGAGNTLKSDTGLTASLFYLGNSGSLASSYTADDIASLDVVSSATGTTAKGAISGTYTLPDYSTSANGDVYGLLLSYASEGTTYYNISSITYTVEGLNGNDNVSLSSWTVKAADQDYSIKDGTASSVSSGGGWTAVPEPSTAALALAGLALLLKRRKA